MRPQGRRVTDSPTGRIEITDLGIAFGVDGRMVEAVQRFTLMTTPGEFVALLGPSGWGKTTVLNVVAGVVQPAARVADGRTLRCPGCSDAAHHAGAASRCLA